MRKTVMLALLMIAWVFQPVFADDTQTLEPMTVEAEKEISAERNRKTVDLQTEARPVISTVPDALDRVSGVDVQRRAILTPKNSQVRLRGFDERRSLILLDGRPLNGAGVYGGFFVDWTSLSLLGLGDAVISKGAFSAKYGNTLGGTINLIPTVPAEVPEAWVSAGYKRYDTYSVGGSASGRYEDFGGTLAAGYNSTDGNLRNSEADRIDLGGSLHYFWGADGEIRFGLRHTDGDFQMPVENIFGQPGFDPDFPESKGELLGGPGVPFAGGDTHGDGSYFNKRRTELDLSLRKDIAGIDSDLKLYYNYEEREDFINSFDTGRRILERELVPDESWGWLTHFGRPLEFGGRHRIGFGVEGNYIGYGDLTVNFEDPTAFTRPNEDFVGPDGTTRRHGVYIDDEWAPRDDLDLYFGLRYENYYGNQDVDQVTGYVIGPPGPPIRPEGFETVEARFDEDAWLPKFGMVYRPFDDLALHARAARATRMPDNPAFFWYYAGYQPELDPRFDITRKPLSFEDARQYEIGITTFRIPGMTLGISAYYFQVDDYIRWIFGYPPSRVVYNIDEVELYGFEVDLEGRIYQNWYGFANYSYQQSEKKGDVLDASSALSDALTELPENKVNWGVAYRREDGMEARLTFRWVDDRQVPSLDDTDNPDGTPLGTPVTLEDIDDFITVDLLLRYPVWKRGFEGFLTASVENLFDEDYEEELGFPQPGQSFGIGVEVRF